MTHKEKIELIDRLVGHDPFPTVKKIQWVLRKDKIKLNAKQLEYLKESVLFEIQDRLAGTNLTAVAGTYTKYLKKHFPDEWNDEEKGSDTPFNVIIDFKNESENKI